MVSAAAGNAASSAVFVPKEFVKQQLQGARAAGSSLTAFECISLTIREKVRPKHQSGLIISA